MRGRGEGGKRVSACKGVSMKLRNAVRKQKGIGRGSVECRRQKNGRARSAAQNKKPSHGERAFGCITGCHHSEKES